MNIEKINKFLDYIYEDKFGKCYSTFIKLEVNQYISRLELKNLLISTTGIDSQDILFLICKFDYEPSFKSFYENFKILEKVFDKLGIEEVV